MRSEKWNPRIVRRLSSERKWMVQLNKVRDVFKLTFEFVKRCWKGKKQVPWIYQRIWQCEGYPDKTLILLEWVDKKVKRRKKRESREEKYYLEGNVESKDGVRALFFFLGYIIIKEIDPINRKTQWEQEDWCNHVIVETGGEGTRCRGETLDGIV